MKEADNRRRSDLILLKLSNKITPEEEIELAKLEKVVDKEVDKIVKKDLEALNKYMK